MIPVIDFSIPEAKIFRAPSSSGKAHGAFWDAYAERTAQQIFECGGLIIDIGGGMRIDPKRGDRVNARHVRLFSRFLTDPKVRYRVTDYTDKYRPDFVEDIHRLSFADSSIDGLFCIAVLEHVYDPKKATEEIARVLKKNGIALLYVPFLYRYHANVTQDYRDYYRYSKDAIAYLFRTCSTVEICPVRGFFESLLRFTPLHHLGLLRSVLRRIDWSTERLRRLSERQTSGYFVRITK